MALLYDTYYPMWVNENNVIGLIEIALLQKKVDLR